MDRNYRIKVIGLLLIVFLGVVGLLVEEYTHNYNQISYMNGMRAYPMYNTNGNGLYVQNRINANGLYMRSNTNSCMRSY